MPRPSTDHSYLNRIGFLPCRHVRAPPCKPLNCHTNQNFSCPDLVSGVSQLQLNSQTSLLTLSEFISKRSDPARDLSRQVNLLKSAGTVEVRLRFIFQLCGGPGRGGNGIFGM